MLHKSFSLLLVSVVIALSLLLAACNGNGDNSSAPPSPSSDTATSLTINNPAQGAALPAGPVLVSFDIHNSPVPPSTTQPRMHFYVDDDPIVYQFFDGPGNAEEGAFSGVRYKGAHTHFVHWKSGSSIQINALASGPHKVRLVLVDQSETELASTEKSLAITIMAGTGGDLSLQEVVSGLNVPVQMATTPDGRIFVNELTTGNIRVVTPTTSLPWGLQSAPFATLDVVSGGEQGLLGIAVDPNFDTNGYVYVYYTANDPRGPTNRLVRFTATISGGNTVATSSTPSIILDGLPTAGVHNAGIIHFGPDGMLYIIIGEAAQGPGAQSLNTLAGKILRIKPDGTIPSDNPFVATLAAPYSAIYSYGYRNSFGFTFHPHTNDLWETENGESDNDEINRIIPGGNYGYPTVTGIKNDPRFIDPIIVFTPTIAPTGIVGVRDDSVYPAQYFNNLLFVDFDGGQLHRIVLGGAGLTDLASHSIACSCGKGALFSVMHGLNLPGQDGYVYVTNSTSIFRVVVNNP